MNQAFHLSMYPRSAFSVSAMYAPLHSKLSGIHYRYFGDEDNWQASIDAIPIAKIGGVYATSCAILEGAQLSHEAWNVQIVRTKSIERLGDIIAPNTKQDSNGETTTTAQSVSWGGGKQGGQNALSSYAQISARAIHYFGITTDLEELQKYVDCFFTLGKKQEGVIAHRQLEVAPDHVNGIVDRLGNPLRPIPVELAKGALAVRKDAIVTEAAWQVPYWSAANFAACYVPSPTIRSHSLTDIRKEIL